MMIIANQQIVTGCMFIWIGFVSAISFMEAWLKFRAPGVTLSIGLGIGRIVFAALNKVEWTLAAIIILNTILITGVTPLMQRLLLPIAVLVLVLQTWWLLPALGAKTQLQVDNLTMPTSGLHLYYVVAEVIKVAALLAAGIMRINQL